MSRQRLGAVLGAILLAVVGTVGMVAYVSGAEDRAASGEVLAQVFIVQRRIPAGTPAERVVDFVQAESIPQKLINRETVGALEDIEGLVTAVDLLQGEALSIARFADPASFDRIADGFIDRPAGLQEITLALSPDRAGGGLLVPGDTVGVLMTFEPFGVDSDLPVEVDGIIVPPGGNTNSTTHQALHKVLITNVQLEEIPKVAEREGLGGEEDKSIRLVPSGNLLVTLAVDITTAERLVFALEFGTLWLTNEPADTVEGPSSIQNRGTIYEGPSGPIAASVAVGDQ